MKNNRDFIAAAAFLILIALFMLTPAQALPALGRGLRALSLSGGAGNAGAWCVVLLLTALPALGLLWRGRSRWDWLLLLAAGEIFAGLYLLVNPALVTAGYDAVYFLGMAFAGSVAATVLAWAVLRWLGMERRASPGRTLERLMFWSAVLLGWLGAWSQGAQVWSRLQSLAEGNTAPDAVLWPTQTALAVLAVADFIPTLLGCAALIWGGKLALAMEADPFGETTAAAAEKLSRQCRMVAAASVLVCAGGNLLQFACISLLRSMNFSVSLPLTTVLLAVALDLLCQYIRRAKAVNDDNQSII